MGKACKLRSIYSKSSWRVKRRELKENPLRIACWHTSNLHGLTSSTAYKATCGHLHYATDVSRHRNRLHSRLCPAGAVRAHMQTTLLCGLSRGGGPDQLSRSSLREISNVVRRMTFRDIWSSSHSISRQKSSEQGTALLATLSLSDLLVLTHWSTVKMMPRKNFQTVFYDRCNFKDLTIPVQLCLKELISS